MTVSEIREGLPRIGFEVAGRYTEPLPTITTTLSRMVASGDVITQPLVAGKNVYKWNVSAFKHSPLKYLGQRYKSETPVKQPAGKKTDPNWWRHLKEQAAKSDDTRSLGQLLADLKKKD